MVVAAEQWTSEVATRLLQLAAHDGPPVLLVIDSINAEQLVTAVHCRVVGVLTPKTVTTDELMQSVEAAAAGGGILSAPLVGSVLRYIGRLRHELLAAQGLTDSGLSP